MIVDIDLHKLDTELARIGVSRVKFEEMMGWPIMPRMEDSRKLHMWHAIKGAHRTLQRFKGWFPDATVTSIRFMDE